MREVHWVLRVVWTLKEFGARAVSASVSGVNLVCTKHSISGSK